MGWPAKLPITAFCGCAIIPLQKSITVVGEAFIITASGHKLFVWGLPLAVSYSFAADQRQTLARELLYTGLTRASESVEIWANGEVLDHAIARSLTRTSGLAERLSRSRSIVIPAL